MRVLAGKYKSRKIMTINSPETRPMMSKVREAVFNSLQFHIEGNDVLDLYAGSGSMGIEALSRGAGFVTFVDHSKKCVEILNKNLKNYDLNFKITNTSAKSFITNSLNTYKIIFYDPPFLLSHDIVNEEVNLIANILSEQGYLVVHRHSSSSDVLFSKFYEIIKEKKYGQSKILLLRKL